MDANQQNPLAHATLGAVTLELPAPRTGAPARRFPWVTTLAPAVMAVVLVMVLRSPMLLAMAALGPVLGVASFIEGRRQAARARAHSEREFAEQLSVAVADTRAALRASVTASWRAAFGHAARALRPRGRVSAPADPTDPSDPVGSALAAPASAVLALGIADARVSVALRGAPAHSRFARSLRASLERVSGVPVGVPWHLLLERSREEVLVHCSGDLELARAAVRAITAQLVARGGRPRTPRHAARAVWAIDAPDGETLFSVTCASATTTHAESSVEGPPPDLEIELLSPREARVTLGPGVCRLLGAAHAPITVRPILLTATASWGELAHVSWPRGEDERGLVFDPQRTSIGDADGRAGLRADVGEAAGRVLTLELASATAHAVIGGTTGSGKSDLITTWVLMLASAYAPSELRFVFADFKGGSTLLPLARLPHTLELVTDLDAGGAGRVLATLRGVLRERERALVKAGRRAIDELPRGALPRLVIVVDESQALIDASPDALRVLSDIAARGRSLGVHLVLSTQHPSRTLKDALIDNVALRVCLPLTSASESRALLGDDAALRIEQPGELILAGPSGSTRGRAARCSPELVARRVEELIAASSSRPPVSGLWLRALPYPLRASGIAAMLDAPADLIQRPWMPGAGEHAVLVLGGAGSGRSNAVAALARALDPAGTQTVALSSKDAVGAFDAIVALAEGDEIPGGSDGAHLETDAAKPVDDDIAGRGGTDPARERTAHPVAAADARAVIVLDDLDLIAQALPEGYRARFVEAVLSLVRRAAGSAALRVLITARSVRGELQRVTETVPRTLRLRFSGVHDHALSGGATGTRVEDPRPGILRLGPGESVQFALVEPVLTRPVTVPCTCTPARLSELARAGMPVIVVTTAAGRVRAWLTGEGVTARDRLRLGGEGADGGSGRSEVCVVTPEDVLAVPGGQRLLDESTVVFHALSALDERMVLRAVDGLIPVRRSPESAVLRTPDGRCQRVRLPLGRAISGAP